MLIQIKLSENELGETFLKIDGVIVSNKLLYLYESDSLFMITTYPKKSGNEYTLLCKKVGAL